MNRNAVPGKYTKSGKLKLSNKKADLSFAVAGVFMFSFLLSFIAGSLFIQPQDSQAVTGLGLVGDPNMALNTSSGSVSMEITPTSTGALTSGSHTLTASTNVPTGYNLNLNTTDTSALGVSSGTIDSPTALSNNTWGFALNRVSSSTAANTITNGFDTSYAVPNPSDTSKWANPSTSTVIKNTTQPATNDATVVYYGAKADMNLTAGTYSNTVRYTATANISTIPAPSILGISPISGTTAGGTAIQIVGTGFTVNDESVTTSVTIGGVICADVSISSNTPTTGQDTIYCNTPASTAGAKDVVVTTWGGTVTEAGGYTYIQPATVSFVSPSLASTIAGTESGPAFTLVGTNFTGATSVTIGGTTCASFEAVSDTQIFCKAPNTINTTGNKEIVVTKSSVNSNNSVVVSYSDTDYPTLQAGNAFAQCSTTAKLFRDERDSQLYYVKKMPDEKCWMVDNLKYAGFGDLHTENGKYLTVDGTNTQSTANSDVAKYVDPGATDYCTGSTGISGNTNTRCGLLYNWYAATNGTGTYAQSTQGNQVTGNICPANFRLPSAVSGAGGPTTNGTAYTAADFPVLNASMGAGLLTTGSTTSYPTGWQPSGAWGGSFSGVWSVSLNNQGSNGSYWSPAVSSATNAHGLHFNSSLVNPGNSNLNKYYGFAVRCVMENPAPTPPSGSNPSNISSTNPAVLDVYPTTGWEGDTVSITSNGKFTNVTNVTIGGTACTKWGVISESLVTCTLPSKTAGTSNEIQVMNNGANVTSANTYTHMKITYFNPSASTVTVRGTSYKFFPNGFTSANCSAMTASNAAIGATPSASMAYFRDTRNKQTYKVKKMADNKCWMVDNIKYIDTSIANTADGTIGMVYNNGDHLGSGSTSKYNTVNGATTQSDANSNKAFYNNPISKSYCYGLGGTITNTLTHCGYLYNWYAATNGTGTYAQSTRGNQVSGNICPANFRLPSGTSGSGGPTTNGTASTAADFPVLNASMNAGSLATGSITSYPTGWRPSRAWGGSFSGYWSASFGGQGRYGGYWSSTVYSAADARDLYFSSSVVFPASNSNLNKYYGFAVRCVLP